MGRLETALGLGGVDVKNAKVLVKKYWVDHPNISACYSDESLTISLVRSLLLLRGGDGGTTQSTHKTLPATELSCGAGVPR